MTPDDQRRKNQLQISLERSLATHCKRGHPFSPENTYIRKGGTRQCRTCQVDRNWYWSKGLTMPDARPQRSPRKGIS